MYESEAQELLASWFKRQGYKVETDVEAAAGNRVDIVAIKGKEKWIVEVKGDYDRNTAQYNVNFDTGVGQIIKSITEIDDNILYGICIPFSRTERRERLSYRLVLSKYRKTLAFEKLNVCLILVRDDKSVQIIRPKEVNKFLEKFFG